MCNTMKLFKPTSDEASPHAFYHAAIFTEIKVAAFYLKAVFSSIVILICMMGILIQNNLSNMERATASVPIRIISLLEVKPALLHGG